jgi:hypothetical protein
METNEHDELLQVTETPDVKLLRIEYEKAGGYWNSLSRTQRAEQVRFMRWEGQAPDGKKHREYINDDPFPWEGGSDARIPTVDSIVQDLLVVLLMAFQRAQLKVVPRRAQDMARAGAVQKVMDHIRTVNKRDFRREAELACQYMLTYGLAAWHVSWEREVSAKYRTITLEEVGYEAQRAGRPKLSAEVMDVTKEDELAELAVKVLGLKLTRARKLVRELREKGIATMPETYVAKNGPCVMARRFAEDIFFPVETSTLQRARVVFVKDFLTETELRENVLTEGWDSDWVDAAMKTRGRFTDWNAAILMSRKSLENEFMPLTSIQCAQDLVEVVWAYVRKVDEDGVPQVWCTVFSPEAIANERGESIWGKHYALGYDHAKMPFVELYRERTSRRLLDSRGVCDVAVTWQYEEKAQCDALVDRTSLEVNPTLLVPARTGQKYQIGPGVKVSRQRENEIDFLKPPPGNPAIAFQVVEMIRKRAANYFGLMDETVLPARWQAKLQAAADNFLAASEEMFTQVLQLAQQFMTPEEMERIAGSSPDFPKTPQDIAGQFDVQLVFDARDLDMEYTFKKIEAVNKLAVPMDRGGLIDHNKLTALTLAAIDPSLAQTITSEQGGASKRIYDDVDKQVLRMFAGNEAEYVENDPSAQMKMQFLQQIVFGDQTGRGGNPQYQQALQENERFRALMQNYSKNLTQSVVQLGQNVVTGRTGVKPVGA